MNAFEFATATRIVFGAGKAKELGSLASEFGARVLFVQPEPPLACAKSAAAALRDGVAFGVAGEPTVGLVRDGVELARRERCDVVVGFGGGSVIDTAKAIASLLANGGDPLDYVEVVGKGKTISKPSAPFIAVPTTAGTGAEVTRNAVLGAPEHKVKVSMRSAHMLARVALVDPLLTLELPPPVTASTGLDALTQVIEPFVSCQANPMTDAICREGMRRAARSLRRAYDHGDDAAAREDMSVASLFGGLALANAGLGAVHGFAAPIGGMFPKAPHGAVCAALLPHVMEANVRLAPNRERFDEVAQLLTGSERAAAGDGVAWVRELCAALKVAKLSAYGLCSGNVPELVERAAQASSMKGNPVPLAPEVLREILTQAL
jgi:alcohol dehydrogenase class IV